MLKKLSIVVAVFLVIVVGAALALPFVVNVDKYRPQIVQAANERINGKLELGKLTLSLWGQIRVDIAGLAVKDAQGAPVLSVKDAYFHLPFMPILKGAPVVTLKMSQPGINVIKGIDGSYNVMKLMKPAAPEAGAAPSVPVGGAAPGGGGQVAIPAMVARARAGAELKDARILYRDMSSGLESNITDFNLLLKNISLNSPTSVEAWADLKTKLGKTLTLEGPFRFEAMATPTVVGGKFDGVALSAKALFDDVQISVPGVFEKKKKVPANMELSASITPRDAKVTKAVVRFFNAEISGTASLTNMAAPVARAEFKSNEIQLKPWAELVPMLKAYDLEGGARLEGSAEGPTAQLQYRALAKLEALTVKAPYMKSKPRFDGSINVETDRIENVTLAMKAPGNDLLLRGKVLSFTKPQATFEITSDSLDLDQLIELPKDPAAPEAAAAPADAAKGSAQAQAKAEADFDAMVQPLREQVIVAASTGKVTATLKSVKYYGVPMTDMTVALSTQGLFAKLGKFSMKMWDGTVQANAEMNLKPAAPTYGFSARTVGLDLHKAVSSQMTLFKNSILGKASFSMDGTGASFNPTPAKQNLKAKGNMRVEKATFATIDIGKLTSEALNQAIDRIAAKYPALKGKKVGVPPGRESRYDFISSDFTIDGGRFKAPNLQARAEQNQGVDLRGYTEVGMIDYGLKANWQVIDTYNLTKAADLNIDVAGTQIPRALAPGNEPVQFPVTVGCKITAPCYTYTEVPEFLAGLVLKNATRAAEGRAKAELQNKASSLIQKAPPAVQQGLEGLKKRLFR